MPETLPAPPTGTALAPAMPAPVPAPVAPAAPAKLESEEMVVAAPLSYAGSAQRIWKLTKIEGADNPAAQIGLGAAAVALIALAWVCVTAWYFTWGLLLVPYRLIRRGQRKRKIEDTRHRELLSAVGGQPAVAGAVPPAWYPDPDGSGQRFWDGATWTEHRAL